MYYVHFASTRKEYPRAVYPISVEQDVHTLSELIKAVGYRFEFEGATLMIVDTSRGDLAAIEVMAPIPEDVMPAAERLIRRFAQKAGVV
jgi:hypothetical protein